jgi:formylmethanofuran dehydrogenase subunit B
MGAPRRGGASAPSKVGHVTCLGCGCGCDDIVLTVAAGRIVGAEHACPLGLAWFGDGRVPDRMLVDGKPAELEAALDRAAVILGDARGRLLVVLGADLTCAAYGTALALADALGAATDGLVSDSAAAGILAGQRRGRATATLGELRNRADLVVYWGVDPDGRYPRYRSRYLAAPLALHLGEGAARTVVSVSIGRDTGPADADIRFSLEPSAELAALAQLRAGLQGRHLGAAGLPPALADLATRFGRARYVAIIHDGEPTSEQRSPERVEALIALTQALNAPTRAALSTLRGGGNRNGAEAVSTWQTGFPFAVDFSRGAPRYRPERRIGTPADGAMPAAALVLGAADGLPERLQTALGRIPAVLIGPRASAAPFPVRVAIDTGVAGIHEAGVGYRMDDIPLPLQAALPGPRSAEATLRELLSRLETPAGAAR